MELLSWTKTYEGTVATATIEHHDTVHQVTVEHEVYSDSPLDICNWKWKADSVRTKESKGNLVPKTMSLADMLTRVLVKVEDQLLTPMEQMSLQLSF
jgi:hypothetical protein